MTESGCYLVLLRLRQVFIVEEPHDLWRWVTDKRYLKYGGTASFSVDSLGQFLVDMEGRIDLSADM